MTTNVVVAAASGIGVAVAREVAPRGRLLVADRDVDGITRLAAELGGSVEAIACELTDPHQIDGLVARIGGDLGALVIPAGLSGTMAPGRTIFSVNLVGIAHLLAAVEPAEVTIELDNAVMILHMAASTSTCCVHVKRTLEA